MITDRDICMDIMKREKVRRLPVTDEDGVLQGVLAINNLLLLAGETEGRKTLALSYEDVERTMKAISAHRALVGI